MASGDHRVEIWQLERSLDRLEERLSKSTLFADRKSHQILKIAYKHEIANPAPLGLFAFGVTTAILQGAVTGISGTETVSWAVAFGLFYGGLAQFLVGMIDFARNNMFGGVAFTSYGSFWFSFAIYSILTKTASFADGKPILQPSAKGEQMTLALWGALTYVLMICTFAMNWCLIALFFFLGTLFMLLTAGVDNEACYKFAGWWGLVTAGIAIYTAAAEIINHTYEKEVLPLFVRHIKQHAKDPDNPDLLDYPKSTLCKQPCKHKSNVPRICSCSF